MSDYNLKKPGFFQPWEARHERREEGKGNDGIRKREALKGRGEK